MTTPRRALYSAPVALSVLLALVGCDDSSTSQAVREAAIIARTTGEQDMPTTASYDENEYYGKVVSTLEPVSGRASGGTDAAVKLLIAEGQKGLSDDPAQMASRLEREALTTISLVRNTLDLYVDQAGHAAAAMRYDASGDVEELRELRELRTAEAEDALVTSEALAQDVSERNERIASLRSDAGDLRDRAAQLRLEAASVSATQAAQLAEQERVIRREADALNKQASMLEAETEQLQRLADEAALEVERLTGQIEQLDRAVDELRARAESMRERAELSIDRATVAANDSAVLLDELDAFRVEQIDPATERAVRALSQAASTAGQARNDARTSAQTSFGQAKQALGDVHWTRAQGLASHAAILQAAANAEPALPDRAAYAARAGELLDQAQQELASAADAYESARSAFEGAGVRGEAGDRIDRVVRMLTLLRDATGGGSLDLSTIPDPTAADEFADSGMDSGAGGAPTDPDSPLGTVSEATALVSDLNFAPLANYIYAGDADIERLAPQVFALLDKLVSLDDACRSAFGMDLVQATAQAAQANMNDVPLAQQAQVQMFAGMAGSVGDWRQTLRDTVAGFDPSTLQVQMISDDQAIIMPPDAMQGEQPLAMRRVNGVWLFDVSQMIPPGFDRGWIEVADFALPQVDQALSDLIQSTQNGDYADPSTMFNDLQLKIQPIVFGVMAKAQELGLQIPMGPGG